MVNLIDLMFKVAWLPCEREREKKRKKLQTKLQFVSDVNIRKMTNILDGSVFNGAYTKPSSFICNFFFSWSHC